MLDLPKADATTELFRRPRLRVRIDVGRKAPEADAQVKSYRIVAMQTKRQQQHRSAK